MVLHFLYGEFKGSATPWFLTLCRVTTMVVPDGIQLLVNFSCTELSGVWEHEIFTCSMLVIYVYSLASCRWLYCWAPGASFLLLLGALLLHFLCCMCMCSVVRLYLPQGEVAVRPAAHQSGILSTIRRASLFSRSASQRARKASTRGSSNIASVMSAVRQLFTGCAVVYAAMYTRVCMVPRLVIVCCSALASYAYTLY